MKVTTFLAIKFLSSKDRHFLISSLAGVAIMGVVISVAAFLVVASVMNGFNKDLRKKILGFSSHLVLTLDEGQFFSPELKEKIEALAPGSEITHFIQGEALLRTEDGDSQGIRIRGVDLEDQAFLKKMGAQFEEEEDWDSLKGGREISGILIGKELAGNLNVLPMLYEKVEILYPFGNIGPTGEIEPTQRAFRVVGTFKTGYYEYDKSFVLMAEGEAGRLFGDRQPEQVGIFLKNPDRAFSLAASTRALPGVAQVKTWQELNQRLFSALKLERLGMGLVLGLMILLASFNILSMLTMVVYEHRKEIAVLKALGLCQREIGRIFYRAGLWIGWVGSLVGSLIGLGLCFWLASSHVPLPSSYYIETLPVEMHWTLLVSTFALGLLLSLVATIFPAKEGKGLSIVEALHCE